ncbi:VWA domain-containing protein [Fodinisporobacter ferrooxydans]|uniref:VWA domain-containing protein n=1 Tax=Fodinisporobacter ferrooxydans TaxID=2901836 RepID=A0ABY4CPV5_9BACL|nr:VWA domain-containing protein [Alicyclobacillaceae bacterium MYW30-H2]
MARFLPASDAKVAPVVNSSKKHPFHSVYASAEGEMVYINMEAVDGLQSGMSCIRDIALIIDISGSMNAYYKNGEVARLATTIVDMLSSYDDDGIDLYFFSNGLVYEANVKNASEVQKAIDQALLQPGALQSTMPTAAFRKFTDQCKSKKRAGTVLFLTDGMMDDGGQDLENFYTNVLHTEFKTRDQFYCYAVEFGRSAFGALNRLDGKYFPEQGPEDLFDLDNINDLEKVTSVLKQVGGMSAIGSDVEMTAKSDSGALIDMVNTDLIPNGMDSVNGPINQIMSFRVKQRGPFNLLVNINGYDPMHIKVTPKGLDVDLVIA